MVKKKKKNLSAIQETWVGSLEKGSIRLMLETQVWSLGREDPLEKGNSLQYSCLENFMDRGAWWATVHGVAKSRT